SKMMTDHDKRREFISGFTGSSGTAVILSELAALWTDGRYFIQAEQELDCNWILMKRYEPGVPEPDDWIIQVLGAGGNVGVDPKLLPCNVVHIFRCVIYRDYISEVHLIIKKSFIVQNSESGENLPHANKKFNSFFKKHF
ncbi:Xaa-Pro aminopeptidase 1, partial [Araneus ventricosus]